jgi:hypothetical protein
MRCQDKGSEHPAAEHPPGQHCPGGRSGARDVAGAQCPPGQCLRGDCQRIQGEGEEGPDRGGHLVCGQGHIAQTGGHPGRHEQDSSKRERPDKQGNPIQTRSQHPSGTGAQTGPKLACAASHDDDQGGRHTALRQDGPQGGTCDAQVQAVDEQQVERDVGAETHKGRDKGRLGVL